MDGGPHSLGMHPLTISPPARHEHVLLQCSKPVLLKKSTDNNEAANGVPHLLSPYSLPMAASAPPAALPSPPARRVPQRSPRQHKGLKPRASATAGSLGHQAVGTACWKPRMKRLSSRRKSRIQADGTVRKRPGRWGEHSGMGHGCHEISTWVSSTQPPSLQAWRAQSTQRVPKASKTFNNEAWMLSTWKSISLPHRAKLEC